MGHPCAGFRDTPVGGIVRLVHLRWHPRQCCWSRGRRIPRDQWHPVEGDQS